MGAFYEKLAVIGAGGGVAQDGKGGILIKIIVKGLEFGAAHG